MRFFGASNTLGRAARQLGHVLAISALLLPAMLPAQNLDPATIQRAQQMLGGGGGAGGISGGTAGMSGLLGGNDADLDSARGAAERGTMDDAGGMLGQANAPLPEELAIRRQAAQRELDRFYQPSPIEKLFRTRTGDRTLKQFGYNLFESSQAISGQLTGELPDSYILGVGDEIIVNLQGATNQRRTVKVNREGQLVIDALPPIRAAGRSLGSVRSEINDATRRTMLGTTAYTSVGSVRSITVYVGGEVIRPGQVRLTSLADVASALARAGGIRRSGSLRNVRVIRGGRSINVDLYGLVGIGNSNSVRLSDGDRVVVPVIGDTIAIVGDVTRPGIYELRGKPSVGTVVDYAGGSIMPRGAKVSISRIEGGGREGFVPVTGTGETVLAGDVLQVFSSSGGIANRVELRGFVPSAGGRPLQAAPTVRDLLGSVSDLRAGTYMPFALLVRRDPYTASRMYQPINLMSALTTSSVPLRADDRLIVFSNDDIRFLNSTSVRQVVLGQRPDLNCPALESLAAIIAESQQTRFNVVTRGIYSRGGKLLSATSSLQTGGTRMNADRSMSSQNGLPSDQPDEGNAELDENGGQAAGTARNGAFGGLLNPGSLPKTAEELATHDNQVRQQTMRALTRNPDYRPCPRIFDEDPQLLAVAIENAISVGGGVRKPGAYPVAGVVSAAALASIAEGMSTPANDLVLDVNRSSKGTPTTERYALDEAGQVMDRVTLRAGDDIRFNSGQPQYESAAVLLSGEFARPGLYSIRKGEKLSELVARAGGITSYAYPYGAVFTRRSVRELQQEGFKRTSRDLTNGLIAVQARKSTSGTDMAAMMQMISALGNTEATGRVVVEADPRVLGSRPELDTVLEGGDAVFMPKRPNFVVVLGDVQNPGAVQFQPDRRVVNYIGDAGGTLMSADKKRVYVVLPNGLAQPIRSSTWRESRLAIPPGSTVIAPKNLNPLGKLEVLRDVSGIFGSLITSVATLAILATN